MASSRARPSSAGGDQSSARPPRDADLLATVLDDLVTIPGTNIGIGLDGLVGLIPGVGDSLTTVLASGVLVESVRRRVPIPVLLRMAWNLLLDTLLGWVPFIGDAADVAHRANRKNYRLLRRCIDEGRFDDSSYPAYLTKAVGVVAAIVLVMVGSAVFALWATWTMLHHLVN